MKLDPGVMQLLLYKFAHAQTLSRMSSLSGRMNIGRVNWMEENQTATYFLRSRQFTYVL